MALLAVTTLGAVLVTMPRVRAQEDDGAEVGQELRKLMGPENGVRGTVTAVAGDSFTVKTDDAQIFRVFYGPNTRLIKDRQPIEAADVHIGDMLMAGGLLDAKAKTVGAIMVVDVDAKVVREARATFGKTWVVGKVTGIHGLKLTIERAGDRQAQVLAVDENTSFRKQRENVTLADVKPGDMISSEGALHDNTFVASVLRVLAPGTQQPAGLGPLVQ
jgi:Domain of unknown function (DUF5666)